MLRYVPEAVEIQTPPGTEPLRRAALQGACLRASMAPGRFSFVTGPNSPNAGELAPLSFDSSLAGSGIVAASTTVRLRTSSSRSGKDLKSASDRARHGESACRKRLCNSECQSAKSPPPSNTSEDRPQRLALLPPAKHAARPEYLLVGAHYDHLGYGESGSLATEGRGGTDS